MLSLMSLELRVEYELFETPADIFNDISTWESDFLHSEDPAIQEKLRTATMSSTERVSEFFWRVRGNCKDLRKANTPVDQNFAMGIIVIGIRPARFDILRQRFGMMKLNGVVLEYWGVSCKTKLTHVSGPGTSEGVWHVDSGAGLSISGDRSLSQIFSLLLMDLLLNSMIG